MLVSAGVVWYRHATPRMRIPRLLARPLMRVVDATSPRTAAGIRAAVTAIRGYGVASEPPPPPPPLYRSLHDFLHAQRSIELSRMPKPARVLLSAGCSGAWYFDWITRWYGAVERHVGIERFLRRPDGLPSNVEWIASSVAAMPEVADGSVDLVFSGQNIEHLFGDDVVGFLVECHRVLRAGGHLVIDSPHREIANLLTWSMNEHTIEYTPSEASELVTLAGFDVTSLRGLWLCRNPDTGAILPLDPFTTGASSDDIVLRLQLAARHPDDAFIWWLEARRTARTPAVDALRRRHAEIFRIAWPERSARFLSQVGERRNDDGRRIVTAPVGTTGYLLYGPYMPFAAGRYDVCFALRRNGAAFDSGEVVAVIDAIADGESDPCLARREIRAAELAPGRWTACKLVFEVPSLRWTGQLRVFSPGRDALAVDTAVAIDDRDTAVWPPLARDPLGVRTAASDGADTGRPTSAR
jgi:SAM-dependent methyltransferase